MSAEFDDSTLPSDVARLLKSERAFADMPTIARARVARRLSIPVLDASAGASVTKPLAHATWKALAAKSVVVVVALGGAIGAVRLATQHDRPSPDVPRAITTVVEATPITPVAPPRLETATTSTPADDAPVATATVTSTTRAVALAPPPKIDDPVRVAAEHHILDEARAAVVRGEPENALVATAEHARRFPRGTLTEERYAIEIRALARLGRKSEARAALGELTTRYPRSFLLEGATQDVESIP